jgi:hypothetical protein
LLATRFEQALPRPELFPITTLIVALHRRTVVAIEQMAAPAQKWGYEYVGITAAVSLALPFIS